MRTNPRIQKIEQQIEKVKARLLALDDLRPGSLSRQYNVCGKPGCRCKDPDHPKRHGPYHQLNYVYRGKKTSQFIRATELAQVRAELANFKTFRRLIDQWVGLALKRAQLKLQQKP